MSKKKRIAFSRKEIFGIKFKPNIDYCFCTLSKMLFAGKINNDGTIDINQVINFKKEELWSYIYYLYFYNHIDIIVFKSMINSKTGKASAAQFYSTVNIDTKSEDIDINIQAKPFEITTLIIFINNVIEEFSKELINPIFDYLGILLKKNILTRIAGITIKTNNNPLSNTNTGNRIKIVTDNASIENANVKIKLTLDENIN